MHYILRLKQTNIHKAEDYFDVAFCIIVAVQSVLFSWIIITKQDDIVEQLETVHTSPLFPKPHIMTKHKPIWMTVKF